MKLNSLADFLNPFQFAHPIRAEDLDKALVKLMDRTQSIDGPPKGQHEEVNLSRGVADVSDASQGAAAKRHF